MEGLTVLESGSVIAVGYTLDYSFHENGLLYKISKDGCIDTLCTIVRLKEMIEKQDSHIRIYPNPVINEITIDSSVPVESASLHILNLDGILVGKFKLYETNKRINFSSANFIPGVYIWTIVSKEGVIQESGKFIKIDE